MKVEFESEFEIGAQIVDRISNWMGGILAVGLAWDGHVIYLCENSVGTRLYDELRLESIDNNFPAGEARPSASPAQTSGESITSRRRKPRSAVAERAGDMLAVTAKSRPVT